jgi:peptidyl-tRNA hydrolase PTH2
LAAPFQYVVLHRQDRPGVYAVQAAHAASEAIRVAPVSTDTRVCVLVAESGREIERLSIELSAAGIHHSLVREDSGPMTGVITGLATEPQAKENVERFFAGMKTLK